MFTQIKFVHATLKIVAPLFTRNIPQNYTRLFAIPLKVKFCSSRRKSFHLIVNVRRFFYQNSFFNKKVLLRERKRHTARRVASTPYVVLTGYPPTDQGTPPGQGTPPARVPPRPGYPPPGLDLAGYPPPAAPWHSGKCCKALWDTGTPPRCELTK